MFVFRLVFGEGVTINFSLVFGLPGWTLVARFPAGFDEADLAVILAAEGGIEGCTPGKSAGGGPGPEGFGEPPGVLS